MLDRVNRLVTKDKIVVLVNQPTLLSGGVKGEESVAVVVAVAVVLTVAVVFGATICTRQDK